MGIGLRNPLRSSSVGEDANPNGGTADVALGENTEVLDQEEGSLLMSLISQLRPGMELSKITFPTFVLEPRSMLERVTDFMSYPHMVFGAEKLTDPIERFNKVLTYFLAGWNIRPKGCKKPYNPVLGEIFRCTYTYADGSKGIYVAEQVSHHPPCSAYMLISPENSLYIYGELRPKSKFLGNSAATIMGGESKLKFLDKPEDGEYRISMPNMYARGLLFGKMLLELGDVSTVRNEATGMSADIEFKTKGWMSGAYDSIGGKVKYKGHQEGEVSGKWSDTMYYKTNKSGTTSTIFSVHDAEAVQKDVVPEERQEAFESRRLWSHVTAAIKANDMKAATAAKNAVEDEQRRVAKELEESGKSHQPRFFKLDTASDEWLPTLVLPEGADAATQLKATESWAWAAVSPQQS